MSSGNNIRNNYLIVNPTIHPSMSVIISAANNGQTVLLEPGTYTGG